jgi:hypothetical protein
MQLRCTYPRTVGFRADGKTICWSQKEFTKEYASFQLPCGKCIECRLDYARQWAIRCVHEASMHPKNSFITLTYSDENLGENRLDYTDFQLFMKKLRKTQNEPIGFFCTGEYGEKSLRKHWHAIVFNYRPRDLKSLFATARGDQVYESASLSKLWTFGHSSLGDVTFESAGYCARYAAKKLGFGQDGSHPFEPISKKSNKNAIGKKWLEKNYRDLLNVGAIVLQDGSTCSIPRYYQKWLKENLSPETWIRYVTGQLNKNHRAQIRQEKINAEYFEGVFKRRLIQPNPLTPNQVRNVIMKEKLKTLQANLKL